MLPALWRLAEGYIWQGALREVERLATSYALAGRRHNALEGEAHESVAPIRARRGGELLNLGRMLLHSPAYARSWNALLGAVRAEPTLPPHMVSRFLVALGVEPET